jgi:hypothetical protein
MPQLDFLIIGNESFFIFFFMLGYFFFVKNILSIISFELKLKTKLEIYYLQWISKNMNILNESDIFFLDLLIKLQNLINIFDLIISPKKLLFGIYKTDLLYLKLKYSNLQK